MMTKRSIVLVTFVAVWCLAGGGCTDQQFTVDVPLRVVSIHPSGVDAPRDTVVEVTFSENLVEATVTDGANFYVEEIDDPDNPVAVEGAITYDAGAFKATFQSAALLAYSREYRVTLTTGILRERDDGPLPIQVTGTFRTWDPPPLRLVGSNPGADSIGVSLDGEIILTFSEPVNCSSVEAGVTVAEVFDPHPHTGPGLRDVTGTWACTEPDSINVDDCEGNDFCVVTFTPDEPFKYSSDVIVVLSVEVESFRATENGGQLPEEVRIEFHVEDPPDFYVAEAHPGSGMERVDLGSEIAIAFSEPVDCDSLAGNLNVEETLDAHPRLGADAGTTRQLTGALTCNPAAEGDYLCGAGGNDDPCVVTFVPDAAFEWSSLVTVRLTGAAYTPGQAPASIVVESTRATSYGGNLTADFAYSFRIVDPPPLAVAAVDPGPGAEMVGLQALLSVTFSEVLNCDSVNDVTVVVTETLDPDLGGGTSTMTGALTCAAGSPTVTFDPDADFNYSSLIDVVLKGGPFDAATYPQHALESAVATSRGGQLPADFAFGFISLDPPPLYVIGTSPAAGSIRVGTDANIEITFSEALDCASITNATFTVNEQTDAGGSIAHNGTIICNAGDPLAVFDPDLEFQLSSLVTVNLDASIRSARATSRGGTLQSDFTFSFSTADPLPLLVVSTFPGGFQDNVTADTDIVVTFSEAVDRASLDPSSFVVEDVSDPGNPVPVECGVPDGTYVYSSGDAVVTCDPAVDFEYDATIRVTLTTALRSAVATSGGGNLPFDVVWEFDIIPVPPIEVVDIVPRDGAQNIPIATTIAAVFNQDIMESTLITHDDQRSCAADLDCPGAVGCGNVNEFFCDPDPANLTVWINPGNISDISASLPLDMLSYDSNTLTAVFAPVGGLIGGLTYTFTIRGGLTGVRGRFGASILVADFVSSFSTGINTLLSGTIPHDGATGVPVSTAICAIFIEDVDATTITTASFQLSFDDDFGTHAVPISSFTFAGVDPFTMEPDLTGTYTNNMVCVEIAPEFWDCHPDARPLLYNTTYTATLADTITNADGSINLIGGYAWIFTTGGPPQVVGAYGENQVVTVDPLAGGTDVPVNCAFHVVFAAEVDPVTVDDTRLQILDDAGAPVAVTVSTSADLLEAVVTPVSLLNYDTAYTLVLSSGYGGVWLIDGSYLDADFLASFETSPPTYAFISPPQGENTSSTALTPIVFTRYVHFPSLTEANIYAVDNTEGVAIQGVVATNTGDPDSCILQTVPTYEGGNDVTVFVTTGVQDFRGNPLAAGAEVNYDNILNTPAVPARIPDAISDADITPANGSDVPGDQVFVLTLPAGALKHRYLPQTFNRYSIGFMGTGGAGGCPVETLGSSNVFTIGAVLQPDLVAIRASRLLRSGCGYRITLHQDQFSNIYAIANDMADVVVDYTGESVQPTLAPADIRADAMGGADLPADGLADVWPRTSIWAIFNEGMDPASFSVATLDLVCDANPVAGSIAVEGATATFQPLLPLGGGASCTFTVGGAVTDLAGNPLGADMTAVFTVEEIAPSVTTTVPADGAGGVAVDSDVTITFSEPVDPATLVGSTVAALGTVRLVEQVGGVEVYGCIEPGAAPDEIVFSPFRDLQPATAYDLSVTTGAADFGGTPMAADFTAGFTTQ